MLEGVLVDHLGPQVGARRLVVFRQLQGLSPLPDLQELLDARILPRRHHLRGVDHVLMEALGLVTSVRQHHPSQQVDLHQWRLAFQPQQQRGLEGIRLAPVLRREVLTLLAHLQEGPGGTPLLQVHLFIWEVLLSARQHYLQVRQGVEVQVPPCANRHRFGAFQNQANAKTKLQT